MQIPCFRQSYFGFHRKPNFYRYSSRHLLQPFTQPAAHQRLILRFVKIRGIRVGQC